MLISGIVITAFGVFGVIAGLYLRFTVKSPILTTKNGDDVIGKALSIQQILNITFVYLVILNVIFILIGINFILS